MLGLSAAPAQPLTALISCAGHMVNLEKPEQFARATLDSPGQLPMW